MVSRGFKNSQTWQYVKSIRAEYYKRNSVKECVGFVPVEDIMQNFERISLLLGINNMTSKLEKISEKDISIGAEMFLYLNLCPSYWVYFYHNILNATNSIPEIIQLTLNTLKKKTNRKGELIATQLLSKLSSELGFEYIVPTDKVEVGGKIDQKLLKTIKNVKGE